MQPLSYLRADHEHVVGLGVLAETAAFFGCGHAPKGIMRGKLAIPIHDRDGRLMAYCGRDYEGGPLTFPAGFKPEEHIFNAERVIEGDLYLTRDPLEVILAWQNGVENVVAFLTDTIQPLQLEMLASLMDAFWRRVLLHRSRTTTDAAAEELAFSAAEPPAATPNAAR